MFPVKLLCEMMGIQRSSFYNWKAHLSKPSEREKVLVAAIMLFKDYHLKYPSHSYRWLNALALIHIPLCRWLAGLSLNKTGSRNSSSETE